MFPKAKEKDAVAFCKRAMKEIFCLYREIPLVVPDIFVLPIVSKQKKWRDHWKPSANYREKEVNRLKLLTMDSMKKMVSNFIKLEKRIKCK